MIYWRLRAVAAAEAGEEASTAGVGGEWAVRHRGSGR